MFYPANADILTSDIDGYLREVPESDRGYPLGFVVPHAGYIYSGLTAAHAYRHVVHRSFRDVVIIAPSHFDSFNGLSVFPGDALETPLGTVNVSSRRRDEITELEGVVSSQMGFGQEHSLEVQLPFLQTVLRPGWELLPVVMGNQIRETVDLASTLLMNCLNKATLIVISSDLSHYYPYEQAKKIDGLLCSLIREGNLEALWDAYAEGEVEACGFGPIFALLEAVSERTDMAIEILDYRNSGDTAGPRRQVVGYCAIGVFWRSDGD